MKYSSYSPYARTRLSADGSYLDIYEPRIVPAEVDDVLFEITETYHLRPDLLASDLYGDSRLWWVFVARNPNTLVDPLGDFVTGARIYLPKQSRIQTALGI